MVSICDMLNWQHGIVVSFFVEILFCVKWIKEKEIKIKWKHWYGDIFSLYLTYVDNFRTLTMILVYLTTLSSFLSFIQFVLEPII